MEAYLSPLNRADETVERISIEGTVGIFRKNMDVYALVGGEEVRRGIRDTQVSRRQNGLPPVEFITQRDAIKIQNNGNTKAISVENGMGRDVISKNNSLGISSSATVNIGRNTEFRLTIEQDSTRTLSISELEDLGLEEDGPVVQGVKSAVYVQAVADNLRQASDRSPNDVLKYTTELHNFVHEQPVDSSGYEDVESKLAQMVDRLESKTSRGSLRGSGLDEEWREEIDRVAHQVERLYSRRGEV